MNTVSIIGAGRLGTSLGFALLKKGYKIGAFSCQKTSSLNESQKILKQGYPSTDNIITAEKGDIVILAVPDDKINEVIKELDGSKLLWSKKFVFHCSGLLSSKILDPLKNKGAFTASVHPIFSFSQKKIDPKLFKGIYFGLEGNQKAISASKEIIQDLEGQAIIIKAKDKPLYHTACSIASNYLIVLLDTALELMKKMNLKEELALQALLPLMQGTLHNVKKFKTSQALTGPLMRSDKKSVESHLDSLKAFPSICEIYKRLGSQALKMAQREKKLSQKEIKALKTLLEGK